MAALLNQPTGLKQSAANEWRRKGDNWAPDEKDLSEVRRVCRAMAIGNKTKLTMLIMIGRRPRTKMSTVQAQFPSLLA